MADIQFRVDAVLGDTSTLRQQIANLNTQLSLQLDNSQALTAIQQVQTQINNLRNSLNMSLNVGNIGGNVNVGGNGGGNGNGNANIASANLTTETLQQTSELYSRISATVDGLVQRIVVARDEQGQIASGTITISDGIQTWVRNLEFVDGEFQRVLATGRDNISTISRSNELYREAVSLIRQIAQAEQQSVKSNGNSAVAIQEKLAHYNSELTKLMQSSEFNELITEQQRQQLTELSQRAVLETNIVNAKVQDAQIEQQKREAIQQGNQLYREAVSLINQIAEVERQSVNAAGETANAQQQKLNSLNNELTTLMQSDNFNNLITAEQREQISNLARMAVLNQQVAEAKSADAQRAQQQHSAYSRIASLMKEINTTEMQMNGTEGNLKAAYQNKLNILNQELNTQRQILVNSGLTNSKNEQELSILQQKLNAEKQISAEKDKQRNNTANTKGFSEQLTNTLKMSLMWGIAYKLWNQISEGIQECIQYAKDYDEALTNIRIVTMGTREETEKLMDTYNEIGQTLGAKTTDVAESAVGWLRQGYSQDDTNTLVQDSVILSKLALIDNAEATQYLTSALKGYKLEAKDALGVIDQLVSIDLKAATSSADLAEAIK